jgi:hypothetical protein
MPKNVPFITFLPGALMKIYIILFTLLFCLTPALAQTAAVDTDDNQVWNETQFVFPIAKQKHESGRTSELSFFVLGIARFGQNARHFSDERVSFGFNYKYNKYVTLTPSYLYSAAQPAAHKKAFESRFRFAVSLENKWKKFSIDDRNLVEYRLRNSTADTIRYRNRFRFLVPVVKGDKEIFSPYVADEVFYDSLTKKISRNEIYLGLVRKLTPNISADMFYMWRMNRIGTPKNLNIIGVNLKIKIGK